MAYLLKLRLGLIGLLTISSVLFTSVAQSEEVMAGAVFDESKESEVVQKARRRSYLGGRDEGDLVVQPQLTAPTRKISPQVENAENSADD